MADDENSYAKDGKLYIKPTLTANKIGRYEVENGYVHLNDCTDSIEQNCKRQAGGDIIINPIRSARLNTKNSFTFKYGRVEVIAKFPKGDWLWPGKINMKQKLNFYIAKVFFVYVTIQQFFEFQGEQFCSLQYAN